MGFNSGFKGLNYRLQIWENVVRFSAGTRKYYLLQCVHIGSEAWCPTSEPGPTQPSLRWVSGVLSTWCSRRSESLPTHLYSLPKLRKHKTLLPHPKPVHEEKITLLYLACIYLFLDKGYIWTDYKTNAQIAKELKIAPILDKLLEYKRNWIQHVNRMSRNRLPRVMKHYSPTGRRNHGRPLKDTWDQNRSTSGPTPWQIYDDDDDKFPCYLVNP